MLPRVTQGSRFPQEGVPGGILSQYVHSQFEQLLRPDLGVSTQRRGLRGWPSHGLHPEQGLVHKTSKGQNWEWWLTPVILAFEKLRQEDCLEFETSLEYMMSSNEASAFLGCLLTPAHLDCVILHGHEVQECGVYWVWPSHHSHQLLLQPGIGASKAQYFSNLGVLCNESQG